MLCIKNKEPPGLMILKCDGPSKAEETPLKGLSLPMLDTTEDSLKKKRQASEAESMEVLCHRS